MHDLNHLSKKLISKKKYIANKEFKKREIDMNGGFRPHIERGDGASEQRE